MTDEEKKAIEGLFHLAHINTYLDLEKEDVVKISRTLIDQWRDKTEILLNLIEKQQTEIEELKKENLEIRDWKYVIDSPIDLDKLKELDLIKIKGKEYVSKDKLKAKIEEIDKEIEKKREIARNPMDRVSGRLLTDSIVELEKTKKVLQSLLEKE